MITEERTVLFPFCGLGAGAIGFLDAQVTMFGRTMRFRSLGGIDADADACADFERLTGSPALVRRVGGGAGSDDDSFGAVPEVTARELCATFGSETPDVVFMSPPCKGASGLLPKVHAESAKYRAMNRLALRWIDLMLEAWPDPPGLLLLENVPRLKTRAGTMVRDLCRLLRAAGYVISDGFHDCGEIGGLAQHRRRYLLVARLPRKVAPILYQPPRKRVRACGEVLGQLPVPGSPEAARFGKMHELPRISWRNWVRLSLIPAGGDWRDLEGVLEEGEARRKKWKRQAVESWDSSTGAIAGPGGNGVQNVADPRVRYAYDAGYAVLSWEQAARTIAGGSAVGQGAYAVADPRVTVASALPDLDALDPSKPPPFVPVIIASDGTWHRPLTTLELAVLQGLPFEVDGEPLSLAGTSTNAWRERIGNAVPPPAASAIASQMLTSLASHSAGSWSLSGSGSVWVRPEVQSLHA